MNCRIQSGPLRQLAGLRAGGNCGLCCPCHRGRGAVHFDLTGSLRSRRGLCLPSRAPSVPCRTHRSCSSSLALLLIHRLQWSVTHRCKVSFMDTIKHSASVLHIPSYPRELWTLSDLTLCCQPWKVSIPLNFLSLHSFLMCILYIIRVTCPPLITHPKVLNLLRWIVSFLWGDNHPYLCQRSVLFTCLPGTELRKEKQCQDIICRGRSDSGINRL